MKAFQIPAYRSSMRGLVRSFSASVSNLRRSLSPTACLSVAAVATAALFFFLGLQCVPAVFISGITALSAVAVAPMGDSDDRIDPKGGDR